MHCCCKLALTEAAIPLIHVRGEQSDRDGRSDVRSNVMLHALRSKCVRLCLLSSRLHNLLATKSRSRRALHHLCTMLTFKAHVRLCNVRVCLACGCSAARERGGAQGGGGAPARGYGGAGQRAAVPAVRGRRAHGGVRHRARPRRPHRRVRPFVKRTCLLNLWWCMAPSPPDAPLRQMHVPTVMDLSLW